MVSVTTTDNRIASQITLKSDASFTYNMDVTAMKQAVLDNVIDWNASTLPAKDTLSLEDFTFEYKADKEMAQRGYFTVDKGSVTVNGVSLTVCEPTDNRFSVAIIPYTMEHTNFCDIKVGSTVNLEFDIIGKYIARLSACR